MRAWITVQNSKCSGGSRPRRGDEAPRRTHGGKGEETLPLEVRGNKGGREHGKEISAEGSLPRGRYGAAVGQPAWSQLTAHAGSGKQLFWASCYSTSTLYPGSSPWTVTAGTGGSHWHCGVVPIGVQPWREELGWGRSAWPHLSGCLDAGFSSCPCPGAVCTASLQSPGKERASAFLLLPREAFRCSQKPLGPGIDPALSEWNSACGDPCLRRREAVELRWEQRTLFPLQGLQGLQALPANRSAQSGFGRGRRDLW